MERQERHHAVAAGGVVFRRTAGGIEFLVGEQIDWRTHERTVRLPKGHVDPGETVEAAALREVAEETGRRVASATRLGEHRYSFVAPPRRKRPGGLVEKLVVFFLMEDAGPSDAPRDDEMERILWLDAGAACERLTFENEQAMVRRAAELLDAS